MTHDHISLCTLVIVQRASWMLWHAIFQPPCALTACWLWDNNSKAVWSGCGIPYTLAAPPVNSFAPVFSHMSPHTCICHYVIFRDVQASKLLSCIHMCISGQSSNITLISFSPQTSMSVHPPLVWMVGRVLMRWTSFPVSVPKAGLELPVKALCQHVSIIHCILRPHTWMKCSDTLPFERDCIGHLLV